MRSCQVIHLKGGAFCLVLAKPSKADGRGMKPWFIDRDGLIVNLIVSAMLVIKCLATNGELPSLAHGLHPKLPYCLAQNRVRFRQMYIHVQGSSLIPIM